MNLSQRIELWLSQHPDATPREAIWAGPASKSNCGATATNTHANPKHYLHT